MSSQQAPKPKTKKKFVLGTGESIEAIAINTLLTVSPVDRMLPRKPSSVPGDGGLPDGRNGPLAEFDPT